MIKVLSVFGTRPEVIKMAPLVKELEKRSDEIISKVCITAQHVDMIEPLIDFFELNVDYNLNIMKKNQILEDITVAVLGRLGEIVRDEQPDYVIVQGDTSTSMAASLAAYYAKVKIVHVEAGLRTWNKYQPFPEEVNRVIIDSIADLYCVHTEQAKNNLLKEGVKEYRIAVTGNTVIDALMETSQKFISLEGSPLQDVPFDKKIIVVTSHRKENLGTPLYDICEAIRRISEKYSREVHIVYPVHPNPKVCDAVYKSLAGISNITLMEPLPYGLFVKLIKNCYLVLTDSGGIQEEAPSLGKPVLVMREVTERPEALAAGSIKLVGTAPTRIFDQVDHLLTYQEQYDRMSLVKNPYGDGKAAQRIVDTILQKAAEND